MIRFFFFRILIMMVIGFGQTHCQCTDLTYFHYLINVSLYWRLYWSFFVHHEWYILLDQFFCDFAWTLLYVLMRQHKKKKSVIYKKKYDTSISITKLPTISRVVVTRLFNILYFRETYVRNACVSVYLCVCCCCTHTHEKQPTRLMDMHNFPND